MSQSASPIELRKQIVERLVGATGEPNEVISVARACAERALADLTTTLNGDLSTPLEIEIETVELVRTGQAVPRSDSHAAMTVATSELSPDAIAIVLDAPGIALVVSSMFGGDPEIPATPIERPLSPIEMEAASVVFQRLAGAFDGSGPRALGLRFPLPATITGPELDKLGLRDGPAARVVLSLRCGVNAGTLSATIPQRVLIQQRGNAKASAAPAQEASWGARFSEEVMRSSVQLDATVPLPPMTLGEIAALQPGQIIELPASAQSETRLLARDKTIFVCEFGKLGQNYTVRVLDPFDEHRDFVDGLLSR